jgi:hypothetical protein
MIEPIDEQRERERERERSRDELVFVGKEAFGG